MPHKIEFENRRFHCRDCELVTVHPWLADRHWLDTMTPDERAAYDQREKERNSHQWTTLDGEEFVCFYCDSKTGNGMCPGDGTQYLDEQAAELAGKAEREADQLTDTGRDTYDVDAPDFKPF